VDVTGPALSYLIREEPTQASCGQSPPFKKKAEGQESLRQLSRIFDAIRRFKGFWGDTRVMKKWE